MVPCPTPGNTMPTLPPFPPYSPILTRLLNTTSNFTSIAIHAVATPQSTTTSSSGSPDHGAILTGVIIGLLALFCSLTVAWRCFKGRHRRAARREAKSRDPRNPTSFNIRNRASYGDWSRRPGQGKLTDIEMPKRVQQTKQKWQQQAKQPLQPYQQPHPQQRYPMKLDRVELPRAPAQAFKQGQRKVRDNEGGWDEIELGEAREERVQRVRASRLRELKLGKEDISEPLNPTGSLWPIVKP